MVSDLAPSTQFDRPRPRSMCAAPAYALPSLSSDVLAWGVPRHALLTPPSSAHDRLPPPNMWSNKESTVLPPIAYLDRHIAAPPTPPYSCGPTPLDQRLLPSLPEAGLRPGRVAEAMCDPVLSPVRRQIDWYGSALAPGSRALVEKTCEMICYLWFSSEVPRTSSPPITQVVSNLQLAPSHIFVQFMQKVLETTQVSASVVVLSLHYIHRLRERNRHVRGQPGSEFRVSIAGLMLANKFLDDNTYTNKTWSEVSGVSLRDITKAESEFLRGLGYSLYIDKERFEVWERALKGFVLAQERARREHERTRTSRHTFSYGLPSLNSPSSRDGRPARRSVSSFPRARSTSPHRARLPALYIPPSTAAPAPTYAYNYAAADHAPMSIDSAAANAGAKRSAADAFSPSASPCDWRPTKRPTSMHLEIPPVALQQCSPPGSASTSPLESLNGFARLSIETVNSPMKTTGTHTVPRTLVAPYCMNSTNQPVAPQNLYYYALSGSPSDPSVTDDEYSSSRKGRLRYHQPSTHVVAPVLSYPVRVPVIQSARSSPQDSAQYVLPPLLGTQDAFGHYQVPAPVYLAAQPSTAPAPPATVPPSYVQHEARRSPGGVPAAPFANAGPSGIHFYGATASASAAHAAHHWWQHRGRPICR